VIHIFIAYTHEGDWLDLYRVVTPEWDRYAYKNGYQCVLYSSLQALSDYSHFPFHRTKEALRYTQQRIMPEDYLWILDLDTLPTNDEIKVEQFLYGQHDIFLCKDSNGYNAGSYLISGRVAEEWLTDLLALSDTARCENHALIILAEGKYKDQVKTVPHPAFNSVPYHLYPSIGKELTEEEGQWKPNHLLCHLPGCTPKFRTDTFKQMLNE
jgi:hypothetical protein